MTSIKIKVEGLDKILKRMAAFPRELQQETKATMEATLYTLQEKAGQMGYPPKPTGSKYDRTGTLGRRLGMKGGENPDIFEVRQHGAGSYTEGQFGTNLEYAQYVIGEKEQAWMHKDWWWTIKVVGEQAKRKVDKEWQDMRDDLAAFLEGKGV